MSLPKTSNQEVQKLKPSLIISSESIHRIIILGNGIMCVEKKHNTHQQPDVEDELKAFIYKKRSQNYTGEEVDRKKNLSNLYTVYTKHSFSHKRC